MTQKQHTTTVVVTGAAGFVGSHTVDALLNAGHRVIGVDNFSSGHRRNLASAEQHPGFQLVEQDVLEDGALASILAAEGERGAVGAIIHLAALVSVTAAEEDPTLNFRLNVAATQVVAEAARLRGVPRVVFASSAAVYGEPSEMPISEAIELQPIGQYGCAKRLSEQLLFQYAKSYGVQAVCLRYFNIYGPRQDPSSPYSGVISIFTDRFQKGKEVTVFGDGQQTRDFVHVTDVAQANAQMATVTEAASGAYNVCTGQACSLLDLIEALKECYPSVPELRFEAPRSGDIIHSLGCPNQLQKAIGFQAKMAFCEGIQALVRSQEPA